MIHDGEMVRVRQRATAVLGAALITVTAGAIATGCGQDSPRATSGPFEIVATTSIVGDIAANVAGDLAHVTVLIPWGTDAHEFEPSARQIAALGEADLVVAVGGGYERGLDDILGDGADGNGAATVELATTVPTRAGEGGEPDPHVWTDPTRMAVAATAIGDALAALPRAADRADTIREQAHAYAAELEALDREIHDLLLPIPEARRVLVTNHDALGYFTERYDLRLAGVVIPSLSTLAEPSAADLATLADAVRDAGVTTIFTEITASSDFAATVATQAGDVDVVALYIESLGKPGGEADTYTAMMRTNARRIAAAMRTR